MSILEKKEKRDTVLYVRVTAANKEWLDKEATRLNYATLSEFIDELVSHIKAKPKKK